MPDIDWNICLPLSFGNAGIAALTLNRALPHDPLRNGFETFIQESFDKTHNAQVRHFMPELFGLHDETGKLCAVTGVRLAACEKLFLESYLDTPIEDRIAASAGRMIDRQSIVEVGNLASSNTGSARLSIITITWLLATAGLEWVAFTGNTSLVNSFKRLGLCPVTLCPADPLRLGDDHRAWGRYYETKPIVCIGNIRSGFMHLNKTGLFERLGLPLNLEQRSHVA
ncbi:thermostable hemolysin [Pseudomonas capsici]|uniref:thermostable hemolysin n=1 Tax=Pseudomonas capsici TaxID=2810614 RepID=UPI0021F1A920|nr:thermostable hemolysin [Pseudomonas capsici]MCV4341406.1 thermostable hemolysin [Pseudomonas capsici]